jgi:transforming growth factor-beta-induced protein
MQVNTVPIQHELILLFVSFFYLSFHFYRSKDLFDVTYDSSTTLSDFEIYCELADLAETLLNFKEVTVFAPTNEAFKTFETSIAPLVATNLLTGEDTAIWKDHLEDLLKYHVLPVAVPSLNITDGSTTNETTVNAKAIDFTVKAAILGDTGIFVNTDAEVVEADIDIINGLVHVIGNVLLPSWVSKSIMDIANAKTETASSPADENLVTLVAKLLALEDAELPAVLSAPGAYTVFAPTSTAFLADINDGIDLSPDQLSSILNYHVVEGIYSETDLLLDGLTLTTLQGETLTFKISTAVAVNNGKTMVNEKYIITPNILANNGIVHVIDGVLIPDG